SRRRHTRWPRDWSSDVCSSDLFTRRHSPASARELHEAVFRGVRADAGEWRRVNVRIVEMKHLPPRMERVPARMADWEAAYSAREDRKSVVEGRGVSVGGGRDSK